MNKILLVPVTYNSDSELEHFIDSCITAYDNCPQGTLDLDIIIADNSTKVTNYSIKNHPFVNITIKKNPNIGYLGGALNILNNIPSIENYKYIIISNVDLALDPNFFNALLSTKYNKEVAWIAPQIYSLKENRDKNPKILKRYSLRRLKLLRTFYRYPILHQLYLCTLYKRKKSRQYFPPQTIYAGHGSLIILRREAISKIIPLNYPVFLFGEECFLAEKFREIGMTTYYNPSIKVIDMEHASTGNMKSKFYYKCNEEALNYIISEFYE